MVCAPQRNQVEKAFGIRAVARDGFADRVDRAEDHG